MGMGMEMVTLNHEHDDSSIEMMQCRQPQMRTSMIRARKAPNRQPVDNNGDGDGDGDGDRNTCFHSG